MSQPEPMTPLAQAAAQVAEIYTAYVTAGVPPIITAVMLGSWMAIMSQGGTTR